MSLKQKLQKLKSSKLYDKLKNDAETNKVIDDVNSKLNDESLSSDLRKMVSELLTYIYNGSIGTKIIAIGALIYFLTIMDIIPDFIPITGYSDDIIVLGAAISKIKDIYDGVRDSS